MKPLEKYRCGPNKAERCFEVLMTEKMILYTRRGYPDFTILKNGEIFGFVEVKPPSKKLRRDQEAFKRFCARYNIPFARWSPPDPFPF